MTGPIDLARLREELMHDDETARCAVFDAMPALLDEVERLRAEVAAHIASLAECYRLSGADANGNEDAWLAKHAVKAVGELRADYDGGVYRD